MKKYNVTLYYHTNVTVTVETDSEDECEIIELAREEATSCDYDKELLGGLEEDSSPDIEEI